MKIAIIGASGFVGKLLHQYFTASDLVLIGRDFDKLKKLFPNSSCYEYSKLSKALKNVNVVINLATVNVNSTLSKAEIYSVNVDLLLKVANASKIANVERFINVSSVHALDDNNYSYYAQSKREAAYKLHEMEWPNAETVYLASIYENCWSGKLSTLNKFPLSFAKRLFTTIASFNSTSNVKLLVNYILKPPPSIQQYSKVILCDNKTENIFYKIFSKLLDISFAVFIIIFLGWALLLIGILIKATSKGPAIFKQSRVGKHKKSFTCYKFRTMKLGTANVGTHNLSTNSITTLGQFLRRSKLDELPQVINILRNELSLIGPRPCLLTQSELIDYRDQLDVFNVKPGITGLAQINKIDMSTPKKLAAWDARSIALKAILSDFKIMKLTAIGKGQGDRIKNQKNI